MVTTMAKIKYNNAQLISGVRDQVSGTLNFLTMSKRGTISMSKESETCKRPNQYNNKKK